jgi:hypothetical protein
MRTEGIEVIGTREVKFLRVGVDGPSPRLFIN